MRVDFRRIVGGLAAIAAMSGEAPAEFVVAPGGFEESEGNVSLSGFLVRSGAPTARSQQAYSSGLFEPLGRPLVITQITFRPNGTGPGPFSGLIAPDLQINLSTARNRVDALSSTFAENVGEDDTVVVSRGPISFSTAFTGPDGGPKDFDLVIDLETPFLYDPSQGDLLMDVRRYSFGPTTIGFDGELSDGDGISRVFTNISFPDGVDSAQGRVDSAGFVTRFTASVIPEPSSVILLGGGGLCLAGFVRCRGRGRSLRR